MEELGPNLEDLMQENICKGAENISPSAAVLRGPVLAADQPHPRAADAGPAAAAARAGARVQGLVQQTDPSVKLYNHGEGPY